MPTIDTDAALLDDPALGPLIPRWRAAQANYEAACDRVHAIEATLPEWALGLPMETRAPANLDLPPFDHHGRVSRHEINEFNLCTEQLAVGWAAATGRDAARRRAALAERGRQRLAWWDAEHAEQKRLRHESGYDAAVAEQDRICAVLVDIEDEIRTTPAATIAGVLFRLKTEAAHITDDDVKRHPAAAIVRQTARDLERLINVGDRP